MDLDGKLIQKYAVSTSQCPADVDSFHITENGEVIDVALHNYWIIPYLMFNDNHSLYLSLLNPFRG